MHNNVLHFKKKNIVFTGFGYKKGELIDSCATLSRTLLYSFPANAAPDKQVLYNVIPQASLIRREEVVCCVNCRDAGFQ